MVMGIVVLIVLVVLVVAGLGVLIVPSFLRYLRLRGM
jgi:hypothetical protein